MKWAMVVKIRQLLQGHLLLAIGQLSFVDFPAGKPLATEPRQMTKDK
jgi:hypothetical protein